MTEKLTLADCFKYPEAQIVRIHNKYDKTIYRNIIAFTVRHPISDEMEYEISFCKLILRDISQLTDEEKEYIVKNFLIADWHLMERGIINKLTLIHIMRWCEFGKLKDLLDYFREIGIDIDGMIASGKAVKYV